MIKYRVSNGIEYASVAKSVRRNGKIETEYIRNLGKVIDKTRFIFENREFGTYRYDVEKDTCETLERLEKFELLGCRPKAILDFGDAYFFNEYMRKRGILECISFFGEEDPKDPHFTPLNKKEMDSLHAMILYYILVKQANSHAEEWFESSFANVIYPDANLDGQRLSELFEKVGTYENMMRFYKRYVVWLNDEVKRQVGEEGSLESIVIDSIGIPNKIHFELTAVSNHNGTISEEVRLIMAVQKNTRMPIFMRYVPGNIIDANTLTRTLTIINKLGVDVKYSIFDAGYSTNSNLEELYACKRDFITRLDAGNLVYKKMKKDVLPKIDVDANFTHFGSRFAYVEKTEVNLIKEHRGYAYSVLDLERKYREDEKVFKQAAKNKLSDEQVHSMNGEHGFFVLASSMDIDPKEILPRYYDRQGIEQFFDTACNNTPLSKLKVHSEETFCGHILIAFIGAAVMQMLQNDIRINRDSEKKTGKVSEPNSISIINTLRFQKVMLFPDGEAVTTEPKKKANDAYRMIGIKSPVVFDTKR